MQRYRIQLEVDENWLREIQDLTSEVYDDEFCSWIKVEPLGDFS